MSVRKNSALAGLAMVAVAGLAFTGMAPANAADTTPSGGVTLGQTLVGVGSDTTQWVMDQLTKDYNTYNSSLATPGAGMANFDACVGNTTANAPGLGDNPDGSGFPCGADSSGTKPGVKRNESVIDSSVGSAGDQKLPSGSGDGRTLLRTPSDPLFNDIAFGRSSGPINAADSAVEAALPFAVDKIVVATNPAGPAPASLTGQQVLRIFNGTYTNWDQVGGKNAPIHVYIPKSGSSTRNAFLGFLAALDGVTEAPGVDNDPSSHSGAYATWQGPTATYDPTDTSVWKTGTTNVEEHDPSVIIADKDAIEPFSYGRAQMANKNAQTVRIEGGWSADRELYNVVRTQPINGANAPSSYNQSGGTPFLWGKDSNALENVFGPNGWICQNDTAATDINNAGFWPLAKGSVTNDCGVANTNTLDTINSAASNGQGEGAATSTSAYVADNAVNVSVTSNGATPTGSVQVTISDPAVAGQANIPAVLLTKTVDLTDGAATVAIPENVSGSKIVDVAYLPTNFGANAADGGHTALGSSYFEQSFKIPSQAAATTTALAVSGGKVYGKATTLTATVKNGTTAVSGGDVSFKVGTETKNVAVSDGVAKLVLPATQKAGTYAVTATYAGTSAFKTSKATESLVIKKATATLTESFPTSVAKGAAAKGTVTVKVTGGTATGTVEVKLGSKVLVSGALKSDKVTLTIAKGKLGAKGTKKLTIVYAGSADVNAVSKAISITQK